VGSVDNYLPVSVFSLVMCDLLHDVVNISDCIMSFVGRVTNDKLERIRMEAVLV
jgi:hypothetical protein